jgi:hypothetical protein
VGLPPNCTAAGAPAPPEGPANLATAGDATPRGLITAALLLLLLSEGRGEVGVAAAVDALLLLPDTAAAAAPVGVLGALPLALALLLLLLLCLLRVAARAAATGLTAASVRSGECTGDRGESLGGAGDVLRDLSALAFARASRLRRGLQVPASTMAPLLPPALSSASR